LRTRGQSVIFNEIRPEIMRVKTTNEKRGSGSVRRNNFKKKKGENQKGRELITFRGTLAVLKSVMSLQRWTLF